jgi:hypothetical protein
MSFKPVGFLLFVYLWVDLLTSHTNILYITLYYEREHCCLKYVHICIVNYN